MQAYSLESVQFIAGSTKVIICEYPFMEICITEYIFHVHPLQFPQSRFCNMPLTPRTVGFQCDQSNLDPISRNGIRRYCAESIVLLVKLLHHDIWSGRTQAITTARVPAFPTDASCKARYPSWRCGDVLRTTFVLLQQPRVSLVVSFWRTGRLCSGLQKHQSNWNYC